MVLLCRYILAVWIVAFVSGPSFGQGVKPNDAFEKLMREGDERAERMRKQMEDRMRKMREEMIPSSFPTGRLPRGPFGGTTGLVPKPNRDTRPQATKTPEQLGASGLKLPRGPIKHASGESVKVRGENGEPIIGQLHVTVGDTSLVMMPDGLLKALPESETQVTSENFVSMSMNDIEKKLLKNPKLKAFKTKRSRRFLYVYNTSEIFIDSTRTIMESMYPAVRKYFGRSGIDLHEPKMPLVVIAFASDDQFQEYRRMPQGIVAYYDGISNHVLLYEKSKLSDHAPEIAVKRAISTIAHEGAHQILHNIGVQKRLSRWPMWLSEGLAEFYAPTSVQRGVRWSGIGSTNQLRMMEIEQEWKSGKPLGNGSSLKRVASASELSSLDYAYSWALIHMLSKRHQKELFACIRQCAQLRPLDGTELVTESVPTSVEVFSRHFGKEFAPLEKELYKHLTSLQYSDPVKSQTHYLVVANGQVILTSSPQKVKEIQRSVLIGRAKVQKFANRALAERAMAAMTN
jgi:hypothetical protein